MAFIPLGLLSGRAGRESGKPYGRWVGSIPLTPTPSRSPVVPIFRPNFAFNAYGADIPVRVFTKTRKVFFCIMCLSRQNICSFVFTIFLCSPMSTRNVGVQLRFVCAEKMKAILPTRKVDWHSFGCEWKNGRDWLLFCPALGQRNTCAPLPETKKMFWLPWAVYFAHKQERVSPLLHS